MKGYWFKVTEDLSFSYTFSNNQVANNNHKVINISRFDIPNEFYYNQSQNQAFYFIKNIILNENDISEGDWVIAYYNDIVVGARQWFGEYTEVPVMGADGYDETLDYCINDSYITFKVFKPTLDTITELEGQYTLWNNLNNHIINNLNELSVIPDQYKVNNPYPNPFNPIVNVEIEVPENQNMEIYIYDIQGRLVEKLFDNKPLIQGSYTIKWDASQFASGIYFMKFKGDNVNIIKKVTLLK